MAVIILYPVATAALKSAVDLPWLFCVTAIAAGGCVFPVTFCVTWHRTNKLSVIIGSVGGLIAGFTTWLCVAANQKEGLSEFMKNTGEPAIKRH